MKTGHQVLNRYFIRFDSDVRVMWKWISVPSGSVAIFTAGLWLQAFLYPEFLAPPGIIVEVNRNVAFYAHGLLVALAFVSSITFVISCLIFPRCSRYSGRLVSMSAVVLLLYSLYLALSVRLSVVTLQYLLIIVGAAFALAYVNKKGYGGP